MYFTFSKSPLKDAFDNLHQLDFQGDIIFIIRPGELPLDNPVYVIRNPQGKPVLEIYRLKKG
jgi:hypothetical protein